MSDRSDIPSPKTPNFEQRVRETLMTFLGRQGNPLDRALTVRDLVDTGLLKLRSGFQFKPGSGNSMPLEPGNGVVDVYEPDLTPPPTPGSMTATGSISYIMIEHEAPLYRHGHGHLRTRLYGKIVNPGDPLPTFADAVEIGQFSGTVYAHPSNPATTWRLWIKWETNDGVLSVDPAGGVNGLEAITGQDMALLLEALNGQITSSQLYADLNARINLIDGPPTLSGSVSQRIAAEQIARASEIQAERQARAAALLAEAQARGTAISSETQSRITADSALQQQINMLSAAGSGDFAELLAAVQEEQTARIAGDAAEAAQRTTLAAQVTELGAVDEYNEQLHDILNHGVNVLNTAERIRATASLTEEQTVRATADEALAQQITTLTATVGANTATLTAEQTARATADEALSSSLQSLTAKVNTNTASITAEQQARTTADSALTTSINYLQAQVNGNAASITSEATARANADSALASSITTLGATVNSNNTTLSAAIQNEATARANADDAVLRSVSTLQASAGTGGLIYNGSFANGSAEGWAGLYSVTNAPYGGLPKAYAGVQTGRDIFFPNADASQWMACKPGDEFEVSAWVSAQAASPRYGIGIQYERTNGNTETWTLLDTVTAPTLAKFLRGYWTAPSDARRVRFWGQIDTFGTENPWHITDVQLRRTDARTSANTAAIQTEAEVRATQTGELYAKYGIKLDVNGYVTGWAMNNNGAAGDMIVLADRFSVGAPGGGNIVPFTVNTTPQTINGVYVPAGTYMDAAYIKNGTITNAKIGNLAVDDAKIASLSVSKLKAGTLSVGEWIASANYVAGTQGWAINSNGTAELSNAVVRGTVYANAGTFAGSLSAATGTFAGSLSAATGSFSGSLNAATGTFAGSLSAATGTFSGTLDAATMNSGRINLQHSGSWDWGYARSYNKWWDDGQNGWVFARHADGSTFAEMRAGSNRIWMSSWNDCGIQFPGITMTNGGLTISQVSVIDTLQIADNAVTIPTSVYTDGAVTLSTAVAGTVIQQLSFTSSGAPVYLAYDFLVSASGLNSNTVTVTLQLKRGTTLIRSLVVANSSYINQYISGAFTDTPGAGAVTYQLLLVISSNNLSSAGASKRSIFTLETKR